MRLTDESDENLPAVNFFRDVLVPLADAAREEGKSFFPLRPDARAESYYVEPTRRVMNGADFELRAAESLEDFVNELAALWATEGHAELAAMASRLSALASEMREQAEQEEEDDVSAFMYVMF
jgi:hypothetical protein